MDIFELNDIVSSEEFTGYTNDQVDTLKNFVRFIEDDLVRPRYFLINGKGGSGKSLIIENIMKYSNAISLAPTNTAVKLLRNKIQLPSERFSTIHACIYGAPNEETGVWEPKSIEKNATYIIDESSMIDKNVFEDIIELSISFKNTIIFVGDSYQIEPVGADPYIFEWENKYDFFKKENKSYMNEVKRTDNTILTASNHMRDTHSTEVLSSDDVKIVDKFGKKMKDDIKNDKSYIIIVSTNKSRISYNNAVRRIKGFNEKIYNHNEKMVAVSNCTRLNSEIFFLRNPNLIKSWENKEINVGSAQYPKMKTYDFYLVSDNNNKVLIIPDLDVSSLHGNQIARFFTDEIGLLVDIKYSRLTGQSSYMWKKDVDIATYGYSLTAHKCQGNEWDNVYIDIKWLPDSWDSSRWLYTAMSRGRKYVEIVNNRYIISK